jgi:hypothetical protein
MSLSSLVIGYIASSVGALTTCDWPFNVFHGLGGEVGVA